MERALITCDPDSEAFALTELREQFPDAPPPIWLTDGIALVEPQVRFTAFAEVVLRRKPIFFRHIAPAQEEIELQANESDMDRLSDAVAGLVSRLNPSRSFAVQTRIVSEGSLPYRRFVLNNSLSDHVQALTGAALDCRRPEQIVSVLCTPTTAYMGVSRADQNLSDWAGGEHRFKKEEEQISRAEFKLLEALDVFRLKLPDSGAALDMGASPGGWTRVLRTHKLRVFAIDPADLDARFRRDPGVTHVRKRIEEYQPGTQKFAVLANDLRMDASESVEIMLRFRDSLRNDGLGIITLKLPQAPNARRDSLQTVRQCLERLQREYTVLGARQLFHNRSEVTVALRPA